jgi:hypothetical protein
MPQLWHSALPIASLDAASLLPIHLIITASPKAAAIFFAFIPSAIAGSVTDDLISFYIRLISFLSTLISFLCSTIFT